MVKPYAMLPWHIPHENFQQTSLVRDQKRVSNAPIPILKMHQSKIVDPKIFIQYIKSAPKYFTKTSVEINSTRFRFRNKLLLNKTVSNQKNHKFFNGTLKRTPSHPPQNPNLVRLQCLRFALYLKDTTHNFLAPKLKQYTKKLQREVIPTAP